jgi:hypothetical protein
MTGEMIRQPTEEACFMNNSIAIHGRAGCNSAKIALNLFAVCLICGKSGKRVDYLPIFPVRIDDSEGTIPNVSIKIELLRVSGPVRRVVKRIGRSKASLR